jgi:hypothetical protein|tara:strand:+ start:529 stop:1230 length:702 start_codon:yes stop_codon:yes gene_type:complete
MINFTRASSDGRRTARARRASIEATATIVSKSNDRRTASLRLAMSDARAASGLDPKTWAGAFDCARCARKRLPAIEFSKKALLRMRERGDDAGTCKACVDAEAAIERARARESASAVDDDADATCAACGATKPASAFSKTQRRGAAPRCGECVDAAARDDAARGAAALAKSLESARVDAARVGATLGDHVRETNLEAEAVTGLRAKFVGARGRGRGRGRSANPNSMLGRGGRK